MTHRPSKITAATWLLSALCAVIALTACKGSGDDIPQQKRETRAATQKAAPHADGAHDWCAGHGLPESKCTKCNPELTAGFKEAGDWCEDHKFPESACPVCNPQAPPASAMEVRHGTADDWCAGHGLPESMCTKCNPELTEAFVAAGDWCSAHGFPSSACPSCNPMSPPGEGSP